MEIPYLQVGALPFRVNSTGETEVLLVTSRGTGQWIVPKGWPMDGLSDPEAAAREAYEEAGLMGTIGKATIGIFTYEKAAKGQEELSQFTVQVYPLKVDRQLAFWPEAHQRRTAWMTPALAVVMIGNPTLCQLIQAWANA